MKKILLVFMLVLLSAVLVVSCDDNANDTKPSDSQPTTYKVGDTGPAGGIIFYVNTDSSADWKYLEAGKADLSETYVWGPTGVKCETKDGIGDGLENTKKLSEKGSGYKAACAVYGKDLYENGYTDWFLPSKDELNLMYTNLYEQDSSIGGFTGTSYWSSSEYNSGNYAWFKVFSTGYLSANVKTDSRSVRPVRAFK